jgi:hypothetical protein
MNLTRRALASAGLVTASLPALAQSNAQTAGATRYSIGSTTEGLRTAADGSVTLLIQKDRPADTANWLPAPDAGFNLTMRLYGPLSSVLDGSYRLPAVRRVG